MGPRRWVAVAVILVALGSCAGPSPGPARTGPLYTCCDAADINRPYQPGETLTLHWTVVGPPGNSPVSGVELNAHLTGPYGTVGELKAAPDAGASTFTATPVRPTGLPGEQPVSIIPIPGTAASGYYNLTTSMDQPGSAFSAGSVIQVIPAAGAASG